MKIICTLFKILEIYDLASKSSTALILSATGATSLLDKDIVNIAVLNFERLRRAVRHDMLSIASHKPQCSLGLAGVCSVSCHHLSHLCDGFQTECDLVSCPIC